MSPIGIGMRNNGRGGDEEGGRLGMMEGLSLPGAGCNSKRTNPMKSWMARRDANSLLPP